MQKQSVIVKRKSQDSEAIVVESLRGDSYLNSVQSSYYPLYSLTFVRSILFRWLEKTRRAEGLHSDRLFIQIEPILYRTTKILEAISFRRW